MEVFLLPGGGFKEKNMNCPTCSVSLVITERQGIEIDYCPQCRGVWLDRGELDKIIERSAPSSSSESQRFQDRSDSGYPKKKQKSFLGEIFDF
jgi:uncharacterized protein